MKENLVPLAGRGQRFVNEGYKDPKPLIKVNGLPMVVTATRCLPKTNKFLLWMTMRQYAVRLNAC